MIAVLDYHTIYEIVIWGAPIFAIVLIVVITAIWRKNRNMNEAHYKVQKAIDNILEDGVVEGPKGDYVPHKRWGAGSGSVTSKNAPPKKPGYHGTPWGK